MQPVKIQAALNSLRFPQSKFSCVFPCIYLCFLVDFSLSSFYEDLVTHGILKPLTAPVEGLVEREGSRNFVAPQGISSVVKYYLEQSGNAFGCLCVKGKVLMAVFLAVPFEFTSLMRMFVFLVGLCMSASRWGG